MPIPAGLLQSILEKTPFLSGYDEQQRINQQQQSAKIQQASGLMALIQHAQAQQQEQRMREVLQQSDGDLEKAIPLLIQSGNIKGARDLAPLRKNPMEGMPEIVKLKALADKAREAGNTQMADLIEANIRKKNETEGAAGQEDRNFLLTTKEAYAQGKATPEQMNKATIIYDMLTAPKVVNGNVVKMDLPKEYDPRQRFGLATMEQAKQQFSVGGGRPLSVATDPNAPQPITQGTAVEAPSPRPAPAVTALPQDKPLTPIAKANADLTAGRITQEQHAQITGEGAKIDGDALESAAARYRIDGTMPPNLGRGTQGATNTVAIIKRAAQMAKEAGETVEGQRLTQIANRANAQALGQLVKQKNLILAFENTALKNADLVLRESEKVDRLGSPAIDRWIQAGQKSIAGDVPVARLDTAVRTFVNEYARVTTSVTGGGITSDTARREIETLLKGSHTKEQVRGVVDLMKEELNNRKLGYEDQEKALKASIVAPLARPAEETWDADKERRYQEWKAKQ